VKWGKFAGLPGFAKGGYCNLWITSKKRLL
jgi:hypothetical protein